MIADRLLAVAIGHSWRLGVLAPQALPVDPPMQFPPSEYRSIYRGVTVGGGFESGTFGQAIPGNLGAQTAGVKTFAGQQLLLNWDCAGGLTGGYGGNEHPGFWFVGARVNLSGELGYRFLYRSAFSPYAGAGAAFAFSAVGVPAAPAGGPSAANNLDALAGDSGKIATRYSVGGSYLKARHSLQLTAFAQEALRAPAGWATSAVYYEVGMHAQYDLSQSLGLVADASYGRTGRKSEGSLGWTTEADHWEVVLAAKMMFGKGFWVALDGKVTEDGNKTTYAGSRITYITSRPLSPWVGLTLGIPVE